MRKFLRRVALPVLVLCSFTKSAFAQSCIPTSINGAVVNVSCGQPCTTLNFQIPHLKSSSDYVLTSIPFAPLTYVVAGGTEDVTLYQDDKFSAIFDLPFSFCFYDSSYSKAVIGSNGLITFDEAMAAPCSNGYNIDPIPGPGSGASCTIGGPYNPKASIMAAYSDLWPTDANSPTDRKIQWRVEGTAPCRKFVISFYKVGTYGNDVCTFGNFVTPGTPTTFQIVLYENTGLIDFFIEQKICFSTTTNGNGTMGIQNWARDKAVFHPNRNASQWTANNEGWRFTPYGNISRYVSSELYTMGGTLLGTADTATTVPGLLNLSFPNVCSASPVTQFVVKTTFATCVSGGPSLISFDTITMNRLNVLSITTASTQTLCGQNTGTITATVPAGAGTAPFTYVLNPGSITQVNNPTFTGLAAGPYTITVSDATGCTSGPIPVTVTSTLTIPATYIAVQTSCPSVNDGTLTITPQGNAPFTIIVTGPGGPYTQVGNTVFTGLPAGTYSATYTDATACTGTLSGMVVPQGTALQASFSSQNTNCPGVNDGSITVTPITPGSYSFTLNPGGVVNNTGVFTGLAPNTYSVTFTNPAGCGGTVPNIQVNAGASLTGTAVPQPTSCPTVNNGTITVTANGSGPFTFTLNPGNIVQTSPVFTGLAPNTYTITFVTASGCTGSVTNPTTVSPGPSLLATHSQQNPPCNNINNGQITITPTAPAVAPYNFVLTGPGGPYSQSNPTFTNLAPGTYNYTFTDAAGCTGTNSAPVVLITNTPIIATLTNVMPLCNGDTNGSITVSASGGVGPYQYSLLPAGAPQASGTFSNLAAGVHTFRILDAFGCIKDVTVTLNQPLVLTASATSTNATCNGNDGTIVVSGFGGTSPYQYSINNGLNYQPGATFTPPATGPYPNIRVRDANGCVANTSTVVNYTDNMFLSLGIDTTICAEQSVTFQPNTNPGTSVFSWTPSTWLNNDTIKNPVATPLSTITYTLNASYGPCTRQDNITVTVLRKPVPDAGPDVTICDMDSTLLVGSVNIRTDSVYFVWSPASGVREDSAAATIAIPDSTQWYVLTVTDNFGCNFSVKDSVLVTVRPPVPAYAGNDTIAMLGQTHQLLATGGSSYNWSPAAPLSSPFSPNPLATLFNNTKFTVIVTDFAGCVGYDTVFVQVYEGPNYYTPNAFSPNGDGLNDVFRAIPSGIAKTEYFRVFNRYGQLVFETNQWLKGWDGTFKGKKQPLGVYVWIIKGTDKFGANLEMKGTVTLLP